MTALETFLTSATLAAPLSTTAPELGPDAVIHFNPLSVKAMLAMEAAKKKGDSDTKIARDLFPSVVCKADGTPLFPATPKDEDWKKLDALPMGLIVRVTMLASEASKVEVEEAKKPSPGTPASGSP